MVTVGNLPERQRNDGEYQRSLDSQLAGGRQQWQRKQPKGTGLGATSVACPASSTTSLHKPSRSTDSNSSLQVTHNHGLEENVFEDDMQATYNVLEARHKNSGTYGGHEHGRPGHVHNHQSGLPDKFVVLYPGFLGPKENKQHMRKKGKSNLSCRLLLVKI